MVNISKGNFRAPSAVFSNYKFITNNRWNKSNNIKSNKWIYIILLILVLIALGVGGYFVVKQYNTKKDTKE